MDKDQSNRKNHVPNNRLKEERERRGLAHKDVAELIGLPDPHTVGRWERGESFPQPHYRQKLCQLFGKNDEPLSAASSGRTRVYYSAACHSQPRYIAAALSILGDIKRTQGEFKEAMILYKEAALLDKEVGNKLDIGTHFIGLATAAIGQGQLEQAARLFGFAESLLTPYRPMHPARRLDYERAVEHARAQLGEQVFIKAWSKGHMMTLEEALALNVAD